MYYKKVKKCNKCFVDTTINSIFVVLIQQLWKRFLDIQN